MHSSVNKNESRTFFGHPYPLGSLFFTEMWERFSFYGIRPLLILFMAATVYDGGMGLARENASAIVGIFAGSMYLAALPGGWLADNWLGQQKAVWYGSILIALGHLSIALSAVLGDNLFFIGLMFIVLGSGLFYRRSSRYQRCRAVAGMPSATARSRSTAQLSLLRSSPR